MGAIRSIETINWRVYLGKQIMGTTKRKQPWSNDMTNTQIIANLVHSLARKIEHRMVELGDSYEAAKATVSANSVAGPAVWAELDAMFV